LIRRVRSAGRWRAWLDAGLSPPKSPRSCRCRRDPHYKGMSAQETRVDKILHTKGAGAIEELVPVVYDELKRMARRHRRANDPTATLCTTELVHEAFLKLTAGAETDWEGRAHFFGAASRAMRQVLVDFARRRTATKRGGGLQRVSLGDGDAALEIELDEILSLDEALDQLDAVDPRLRQVVEFRFFAALPEAEIARMLGVSVRTVERDWLKARLILLRALDRS
jgi:RNA polymerase sigma factor (TIGR02999 family)